MADKTYVFKAQYDTEEAVKAIEKLSKTIIAEQANLKDLDKKLKDGKISQVDYATAVAEQTHSMNRDIQERKKYINVIQSEVGSIKRAKAENQILREERNKMVTVYGKNSAAAQELNRKIDANTKIIKGNVDAQSRWYMGVKNGIGAITAWAAGIGLGLGVLKKFATSLLNASDTMQDKWAIAMEVAKISWDRFRKALTSGEGLGNFFKNFSDMVKNAKELAEAMDSVGDRTRALSVAESEMNIRKQANLKILRSQLSTYDEAIAAGKAILKDEEDLAKVRISISEQAKKARLDSYADLGISEQMIKNQMLEYELNREKIDAADKYNKAVQLIFKAETGNFALIKRQSDAYKDAVMTVESYAKTDIAFAKERAKYNMLTGEQLDEIAKLYVENNNALASFDEMTQRTSSRLSSIMEERAKSQDKVTEKTKETTAALNDMSEEAKALAEMNEAEAESDKEDFEFAMQYAKELSDAKKKEDEDYLKFKEETAVQLDEIEKEIAENALKIYEEEIEKKKKAEQDLADAKKEFSEETEAAAKKIATDYFNAGIDERLNAFQEAQDIEETKLKNKLDKGVITEAEYERQIKALKLKTRQEEAKAEKKKAIFDIAINTLVAVVKALPNIPLAVTVGAIGLASGIAVAAKPEPKFRHGTKGALKEGVYATVSEDGEEYFENKKLGIEGLTPKFETKAFIPEGTEIFPAYSKETKEAKERVSNDGTLTELKNIRKAVLSKNNAPVWTRSGLVSFNEATQRRIISRRRLINGD